MDNKFIKKLKLSKEIEDVLLNCKSLTVATSIDDLIKLSLIDEKNGWHDVSYDIPGKGNVTEARVCRVNNGIATNYVEPYMRRRDPNCMLIGDDGETDKARYKDKFNEDFNGLRTETLEWLKSQDLAVFAFYSGQKYIGINSLAIAPKNAGFFAFGLSLLQEFVNIDEIDGDFPIKSLICVAPPFRHTHFDGKQIVVHNRLENLHEIFSYNLYPGPSAKKGIYGVLLNYGEKEGWITTHSSVVQVVTPYDNEVTIMHEGASGGGKSEMHEHLHREYDGTIRFGKNTKTGEVHHITMPSGCNLKPVSDDMSLCHPSIQKNNGKLTITDAEASWFIRVNHITNYGTDPDMESRSIHPEEDLLFLNIEAQPNSTALLWEHIQDEPGVACPNPRFVLPRKTIPDIVNKPVEVDLRSFGTRMPPCTAENPNYGIMGLFHIIPPALAWIWRLVSPRGHQNPSVVGGAAMGSEGIGSYWPFATGKKVTQANLLLEQIINTPKVQYVLCPNQHVGAWEVGFMPQWIMREYLARRGGLHFHLDELTPSRCSILGYSLNKLKIEGQTFDKGLLQVDKQPEVGPEAYDKGAKILTDFFKDQLKQYLVPGLNPLGKEIIEHCLADGSLDKYVSFIESEKIFDED